MVVLRFFQLNTTLPAYHACTSLAIHVLRYSCYNGTLLTLTALAVDLYLAIMRPLNYSSIVRHGRVNVVLMLLTGTAILLGSSELFLLPYGNTHAINNTLSITYCSQRWNDDIRASFATIGIVVVCVVIVCVVYSRVFYEISRFHAHSHKSSVSLFMSPPLQLPQQHQSAPVAQPTQPQRRWWCHKPTASSILRNQRGLATILVLLFVFLCCFLPPFIFEIYLFVCYSNGVKVASFVFYSTLFMRNLPIICTFLDPILYSYRLKDIKLAFKKLIRGPCCCFCSHQAGQSRPPPLPRSRVRHKTSLNPQRRKRRSLLVGLIGPAATAENQHQRQSYPWQQQQPEQQLQQQQQRQNEADTNTSNSEPQPDWRKLSPTFLGDAPGEPSVVWYPWHFSRCLPRRGEPLSAAAAARVPCKYSYDSRVAAAVAYHYRQMPLNGGSVESSNTNMTGLSGSTSTAVPPVIVSGHNPASGSLISSGPADSSRSKSLDQATVMVSYGPLSPPLPGYFPLFQFHNYREGDPNK